LAVVVCRVRLVCVWLAPRRVVAGLLRGVAAVLLWRVVAEVCVELRRVRRFSLACADLSATP